MFNKYKILLMLSSSFFSSMLHTMQHNVKPIRTILDFLQQENIMHAVHNIQSTQKQEPRNKAATKHRAEPQNTIDYYAELINFRLNPPTSTTDPHLYQQLERAVKLNTQHIKLLPLKQAVRMFTHPMAFANGNTIAQKATLCSRKDTLSITFNPCNASQLSIADLDNSENFIPIYRIISCPHSKSTLLFTKKWMFLVEEE